MMVGGVSSLGVVVVVVVAAAFVVGVLGSTVVLCFDSPGLFPIVQTGL